MSLSNDPVPVIVCDDPRIDLNPHPYYLVERGASDIIYRDYQSDGFVNAGTVNIQTQLSDRRTVVSSKVYLKNRFDVTITASAAGAFTGFDLIRVLNETSACPRFSPLMSCATTCALNLNGKQFNQPINRYFAALMKYCVSTNEAAYDFSTFPSRQDTYPETFAFQAAPTAANIDSTKTSSLSPIGTISTDVLSDGDPYEASRRAPWLANVAFNFVLDGTNTIATFSFFDEEILPLSPLIWGNKEVKGLSGLDTLEIYLTYAQTQLNNAIMVCPTKGAPAVTYTTAVALSACSAEFIWFSPRANIEIPPVLRYRYNYIQHQPSSIDTIAAGSARYNPITKVGATGSSTSNSITLQGMPKRIYIFIRRRQQDQTNTCGDTYARIDNLNMQIGNRSGIFAEATPQALYRMAVKNGYQGSWDLWYNVCGSVLCVDFAQDIPLNLNEAPGTLSKLNLQYTVQYTNLYYDLDNTLAAAPALNLELNTVIVYDGMVIIKDGVVLIESNDVSQLDVVSSNKIHQVHYDDVIDFSGGMFTAGKVSKYVTGIKKGFSKVKELAQKAAPYIEKYGPKVVSAAAKAAPIVASLLAAGYTENEIYAMMEGKQGAKGKKGGKRAPKSALKSRAICM